MSIQNGRPGSPIGYTGPIIGYGAGGMTQHPLQSPKLQHINLPNAAPSSPGSHTMVNIQVEPPVPLGAPVRFLAGRYGGAR